MFPRRIFSPLPRCPVGQCEAKGGIAPWVGIGVGSGKRWVCGISLFVVLFAIYLSNGYIAGNNDATANIRLPFQVLTHGKLTFSTEESPYMFVWKLKLPDRAIRARFRTWSAPAGASTVRALRDSGELALVQPKYYLIPTRREGDYANTFGLGAGITALPFAAIALPFIPKPDPDPLLLWRLGKVVSAATVAGTAVVLFLAALGQLPLSASLAAALMFGLCTCAWSVSSQLLLQHGPAGLFLALGAFFHLKKGVRGPLWTGVAFSAAVACRPTCVLVVAVMGIWFALHDRKALLRFCLGAAPIAILLGFYGWYFFDTPFAVGQMLVGAQVAVTKTGASDVWQTPFLTGAAGLLFSPARGLLVYSPVLVVALWGMGRVWRNPVWKDMRPLGLAALLLFIPAAKRFDWWGGWTYGYRPLMESVVLLAFLAIPIVAWVQERTWRLTAVGILAAWSFGTQALGAYAYDLKGWNGRMAYDALDGEGNRRATFDSRPLAEDYVRSNDGHVQVRDLNIDRPENRYRLWSVSDNPISFYLREWESTRARRQADAIRFIRDDG